MKWRIRITGESDKPDLDKILSLLPGWWTASVDDCGTCAVCRVSNADWIKDGGVCWDCILDARIQRVIRMLQDDEDEHTDCEIIEFLETITDRLEWAKNHNDRGAIQS